VRGFRRWDRCAICWPLVCWWPRFLPGCAARRGRLHGSHRARRTTMQPAQRSLLPEQCPAPAPMVLARLPEPEVTAAITLLAQLIAKAAAPRARTQCHLA